MIRIFFLIVVALKYVFVVALVSRRVLLTSIPSVVLPSGGTRWRILEDPQTYMALWYEPPAPKETPPPLILFLHGAGKNDRDIFNLLDPLGEHAGLLPSLLIEGKAPHEFTDNFCLLAPYSYQKHSFYKDPRGKLLQFLDWASKQVNFDPNRVFLFGFSDGATVAVELLTTRRFQGAIIAAYGFTGTLPPLAVQRLAGLPVWIFHSVDDVIFPVSCSDRLVRTLRENSDQIRYSRFESDPEGFIGSVRGHSTGITASKDPQVYQWLLDRAHSADQTPRGSNT